MSQTKAPLVRPTWVGSAVVAPQTRNLEQPQTSSASSSSSNQEFVSPTSSESIPRPSPLAMSSGIPQSYLSTSLPVSLYPVHPNFARQGYQGAFPSNSTPLLGNDTSGWFSPLSSDERPALMPIMVATPMLATHSPASILQSSPTSTSFVASAPSSRHEYAWPVASRIPPQRTSSLPIPISYSTTGSLEWESAHVSPVPPSTSAVNYWAMDGSVPISYASYGIYSNTSGPQFPQHDSQPRIVSTTNSDIRRALPVDPVTVPLQAEEPVVNGAAFESSTSSSAIESDERSNEAQNFESGHKKDFTGPIRKQVHQQYPGQSQPQRQHSSPYSHSSLERASVMPARYAAEPYTLSTSTARTVPAFFVRRRNPASSTPAALTATPDQEHAPVLKRKPLPKIYECSDSSCDKKFDRPSTLKVHEAIHTGAKDYLCEYCARAFTVGSNMKRHMRVCKHKALSPPMTACWFLCVPPNAVLAAVTTVQAFTKDESIEATAFSSVTAPQNRAAINGSTNGATTAPFPLIAPVPTRKQPDNHYLSSPAHEYRQQMAYNPHMTSSTTSVLPESLTSAAGLQLAVKGEKAPMIIGAMFSAQQNVPNSISHLILVHLECDAPLPPVRAHPKYAHLHQKAGTLPPLASTYGGLAAATAGENNVCSYIEVTPLTVRTYKSLIVGATSASASNHLNGGVGGPAEGDIVDGSTNEEEREMIKEEEDELVAMDRSMRTIGLLPLPNDLFEERDSFTPRSRYCYHPAEYDEMTVLPGPGLVPIPYEEMEAGR